MILELRPARYEVVVDGQAVPLTRTETRILSALWQRRGEYIPTIELGRYADTQTWRCVKWHVYNLRQKLQPYDYLLTGRAGGAGYMLDLPPALEGDSPYGR